MKETTKANKRRIKNWQFVNRYFTGHGIDIGCGDDLFDKNQFENVLSMTYFDKQNGNAECIDKHITSEFDFIHASNVLEHLKNPIESLKSWLNICRVGGYIVFTVPDEDLYEQGVWPSTWNEEHKHTFTINKNKSWSPGSINIIDMLKEIPNIEIKRITLEDTGYDYVNKHRYDQTFSPGGAESFIEVVIKKVGVA